MADGSVTSPLALAWRIGVAFVLFAVIVGMAAGANHLAVGLVGLAIVGVASLVLWPSSQAGVSWQGPNTSLSLRVGLADTIRSAAEACLSTSAEHCDSTSVGTARQGRRSTSPVVSGSGPGYRRRAWSLNRA